MDKIQERKDLQPARVQKIAMKAKDRDLKFKKRVKKMLESKIAGHSAGSSERRNSVPGKVIKTSIDLSGHSQNRKFETVKPRVDVFKQVLDPQLVHVVNANNVKNKKSKKMKAAFPNMESELGSGKKRIYDAESSTSNKKLKSVPLSTYSKIKAQKPKRKSREIKDQRETSASPTKEAELHRNFDVEPTPVLKHKKKKNILADFNDIVELNLKPLKAQDQVIENKKAKKLPSMHSSFNVSGILQKIRKNRKKLIDTSARNISLPAPEHLESYGLPKISKKAKKQKDLYNLLESPKFISTPKDSETNGSRLQSRLHSSEIYELPQDEYNSPKMLRNLGEPIIVEGTPKKNSPLPSASTPVLYSNRSMQTPTRGEDILNDFVSVDISISNIDSITANETHPNARNMEDADQSSQTDDDDVAGEINDINYANDTDAQDDINIQLENTHIIDDYKNSEEASCSGGMSDDSDFDSQGTVSSIESLNVLENVESRRRPNFFTLQNRVIVFMKQDCKFHFNGKMTVKVLYGAVEIHGFILSSSDTVRPVEVYSPRGFSLLSIETADKTDTASLDDIRRLLSTEGIDCSVKSNLQAEISKCEQGQAVIILEILENKLTKFLDAHSPFKLFPKLEDSTNYSSNHPRKAEIVLQTNFQFGDLGRQLKSDLYWKIEIASRLLDNWAAGLPTCALLAGGKGVGKSTMLRYLVNTMLPKTKAVIVVDLDPGQGEFTPPGCISLNLVERPLMGPNFTHQKTPFYQLYIGDVNVVHCIPRYAKAVKKLLDYLTKCQRLMGIPILVNTMGFCKGIGWDIMIYIIKLILPTNVIQIVSDRAKNNFNDLLSSEVVNRQGQVQIPWDKHCPIWKEPSNHALHVVPSQAEIKTKIGDCWEMEPRQQRDLVMLAYLSQIIRDNEGNGQFVLHNFRPLPSINEIVPYMVPFSALSVSLTRTSVPASHILATMNGNIVALCGIDLENEPSQTDDDTNVSYPRTLIRTPLSTCYGFGIVKGIDMEKGHVFVNTPLSACEMQFINCFVGCIPIPVTLLQLDRQGVPYVGGQADLPTSREPRRGYFRMRQQNNA